MTSQITTRNHLFVTPDSRFPTRICMCESLVETRLVITVPCVLKTLEYSLTHFRPIALDSIHNIHEFTATFGLWYFFFLKQNTFFHYSGENDKKFTLRISMGLIHSFKSYSIRGVLTNRLIKFWCVILQLATSKCSRSINTHKEDISLYFLN
jgi:hypothetical protein